MGFRNLKLKNIFLFIALKAISFFNLKFYNNKKKILIKIRPKIEMNKKNECKNLFLGFE